MIFTDSKITKSVNLYLEIVSPFKSDVLSMQFKLLSVTIFFLQEVLKPLVTIALRTSKLKELTGREEPTVIT